MLTSKLLRVVLARFMALAAILALMGTTTAHAQLTWDANNTGAGQTNGAGAWLGANQWWNGASNVTWTSGNAAIFGGPATAGGAVTLASPTTVNSLTFNPSFTGTYTLGTAGQTITLNSGITKNASSGAVSIISPISLGGAQTWTNNSTTALTTSNGANLINNGGFQLTVDGTGVTNFGVINNTAVALSGSGNLIKNGSGRLNIGGVNSGFTGTVTVNGGILHMTNDANALGAGNLTLNNGVLAIYWGTNYNRSLGTGNNQVQILGGESGFGGNGTTGPTVNLGSTVVWGALGEGAATGFFNPNKFVLGDAGTSNAAVTVFSSAIDLNSATRTIVVPAGLSAGLNRTTISGRIFGTGNLVKEGGGWLFLTQGYANVGNAGWSGSTTVSEGMLDFTNANMNFIGGGSGRNINVASGAGVRFNALSNAILNRIVETTDEIGIMTGTTANNFDFSSSTGADLPNAFLGNWAGNGAKAEISGIITPGSDGYKFGAKGSSGLLGIRDTLSGANDLTVGQTGSSGIRVNIVAANTHTGETVINTGSKLVLGNNLALQNSALNVGAAGGNFALAAGTNAGRITGETAATSPTFGGLIGSRNLSSVFTTAGGNNETNLTADLITGFSLNVGAGNTFTYTGAIGGFGAGASAGTGGAMTLTKTGLGTQALEGASTYTGGTTISAGKLLINNTAGSGTGTGNVTIDPTGTLGGSGRISGAILGAGLVSPGNSPGILTVGQVDASTGMDYAFEFTATGAPNWNAPAASVNDVLRITNATPFVGGDMTAANVVDVYLQLPDLLDGDVFQGGFFTDNNADFFSVMDDATYNFFVEGDGSGTVVFEGENYYSLLDFATLADATFGITASTVQVPTASFLGGDVSNGWVTQFAVSRTANFVPEPATLAVWSLLGFGLLGWAICRARSKK